MDKIYDLIIVGAGPAGLAASIYASRYKLDHLVFGIAPGGQVAEIHSLENFPGFVSITGADFVARMVEQVENFGVKIFHESVSEIKNSGEVFSVITSGKSYETRAVLLTMGAEYKKINIPGEKEFTGKGVSYCATCDAAFFKEKTVTVIGGGNSAAVTALELIEHAAKVYVIFRRQKMTAEPYWVEKIFKNSKIELVPETNVIEIKGTSKVEKVILDKPRDDKTFLPADGVFVEIGSEPGASLAQHLGVALDADRYVIVAPNMETSIPGVFAAGDITTGSNKFRQVLTACAEGSVAAASVYKKLRLS